MRKRARVARSVGKSAEDASGRVGVCAPRRAGCHAGRVASWGAALALASAARAGDSVFATRVMAYDPAPGQFVRQAAFNDPARALGAPVGAGLSSGDTTKVVSLGGFGGSITLGFDGPIVNLPPSVTNPRGCDFIVYGNAFYAAGDPQRRFGEPAVIEVSRDANGNGLADDAWYVIRAAPLPAPPAAISLASQTWDDVTSDATFPPASAAWVPLGRSGMWSTSSVVLPVVLSAAGVLQNPSAEAEIDGVWGMGDCSPVLVLGDLNADDVIDERDDPGIDPARFYSWAGDPLQSGAEAGSGGGDAVALEWATTLEGEPVHLASVDFVRMTTGVNRVTFLGETSAEVSAVARVRPRLLADLVSVGGERPADGQLTVDDLIAFVNAFGAGDALADLVSVGGALPVDGALTVDDLIAFVNAFIEGSG